jgi:DNA-binding beta-propeller fold protein YncE
MKVQPSELTSQETYPRLTRNGALPMIRRYWFELCLVVLALTAGACAEGSDSGSGDGDEGSSPSVSVTKSALENRAYIVSKLSDELTIIDLKKLEIIGQVRTLGEGNHMAELNADFTKAFVDSSETDESVVVDLRTLKVTNRLEITGHPTHLSLSRDGKLLGIVEEDDNAVTFLDPKTEKVVKRLTGFMTPHFVRWAPDGEFAYVANIGAHFLTKVDIKKLEIVGTIPLDGIEPTPRAAQAPDETGFADAQIDADGILHAADIGMGRVIVYDTNSGEKLPEIQVGPKPWIVYAEHPFTTIPVRMVPNLGDMTLTSIHAKTRKVEMIPDAADHDSNGVNYSPLAPEKAFVMNRLREDIAVVNTETGEITDRIAVGGTTETASTTADGKYIVAAVSSANKVVVIDAVTNEIVKMFDNVGKYPWSVTIPNGQNYCH